MLNQLTQWPTRSKSWTPYPSLRNARAREDLWTESFFGGLDAAFWDRSFAYTNHQGKDYLETAHVACRHLFNHQTHHRVQACDATAKTSATVFPEGVAFSGKAFDRTVVTSSLFEYLRPLDAPNKIVVDQNIASWNQLSGWLREIAALREAA